MVAFQAQCFAQMAQHQPVHRLAGKRRRRRSVVVGVPHHQRAIGALHGDEVDAMGQAFGLVPLQLGTQRRRLRQCAIAFVADQAQIAHDRTLQRKTGLWLHPQHLQLAQLHLVLRPGVCKQASRIGVVADHHTLGVVAAA